MEKENNERKKEKRKKGKKEKDNENWLKIETRKTLSCLSAELLARF